jgi:hypothetical protein
MEIGGELERNLRELAARVCADLTAMGSGGAPGLVFPRLRNGAARVSEQEARVLFLRHLDRDRRYSFSVETPTEFEYQQSGQTPISARIDLTIYDAGRRAVNVELKAHVPPVESIRKDLEKLLREPAAGMWFHVLAKENRGTRPRLLALFREAFQLEDAHLAARRGDLFVVVYTLGDAEPWMRMLRFTGDAAANREAVARAFAEEGTAVRPAGAGGTGKGVREAYFVFAPDIVGREALHLSIRGGSYRLRRYFPDEPSRRPDVFQLPECRTEEEVRRSPRLTGWIPVSEEDRRHNLDEEPAYWSRRMREVSSPEA